jgi:hypothetical protein
MKTLFVLLCVLAICSLGVAQDHASFPTLKPGVVYVFQTPVGEVITDGYQPGGDPWTPSVIKSAFLIPIDGSGPIAMDPTKITSINPKHLIVLDYAYPWGNIFRPKTNNPTNIDKYPPANTDPWRSKTSNPAWSNQWN